MEKSNKKCNKCLKNKQLDCFHKDKTHNDGLRTSCKDCIKLYRSKYYENNPEKIKISKANYYLNNKEIILAKNKLYANNNPNILKKASEKYVNNNPESVKQSKIKWKTNNKEKIKESNKNYRKKSPHISAWRCVLRDSLRRLGQNKEGHTIDLLGYSALELKNHISSLFTEGMSWDNYGEWHIDHIKRVCEFDKNTPASIVNELSNLRPLWATTREINGVIYEGNLNRKKN